MNWRLEDGYSEVMARASSRFADALKAGRSTGGGLIWAVPVSGGDPNGATLRRDNAVALRRLAEREEALNRVVNRDPCTFCGVRGDVGCKHRRAA